MGGLAPGFPQKDCLTLAPELIKEGAIKSSLIKGANAQKPGDPADTPLGAAFRHAILFAVETGS
jgi:hypothetical protein